MVAGNNPFLTKPQFYSTLRLISLAQVWAEQYDPVTKAADDIAEHFLNPWLKIPSPAAQDVLT